jgi:hypothetical protein
MHSAIRFRPLDPATTLGPRATRAVYQLVAQQGEPHRRSPWRERKMQLLRVFARRGCGIAPHLVALNAQQMPALG